jgi:crossover junction endodeoxyribonuclease RuvC
MLILGIDPGLRCTGFGAIKLSGSDVTLVEAGVVRTNNKEELACRLTELAGGLSEIIEELTPSVMVVENLYSNYKHPRTAILMGHARGALILTAAQRNIQVINYQATTIKKSLTGHGRASKSQMQRTIQTALSMKELPEPADVADALAVALCHVNTVRGQVKTMENSDNAAHLMEREY